MNLKLELELTPNLSVVVRECVRDRKEGCAAAKSELDDPMGLTFTNER